MSSFVVENNLTLFADPVAGNQAATKQYMDAKLSNIAAATLDGTTKLTASRMPNLIGAVTTAVAGVDTTLANAFGSAPVGQHTKMTIDATGVVVGVSTNLLRTDLPLDISYTKINGGKPTTLAGFGITDAVNTAGDTLTGQLVLTQGSFDSSDLVTKSYVDTAKETIVIPSTHATGDIIMKMNMSVFPGYLRCNGSVLNKSTYSALYAVVGDVYAAATPYGAGQPWRRQYEFNKNPNGDLIFTATTSLPDTLGMSQAVVTKNRVYLLGGFNANTGSTTTTYTAAINTDGTLGAWSTTTPIPVPMYMAQAVVVKNRVYFIGGSGPTNAVYYAPINADGTLGTWVAANSMPAYIGRLAVLVTKNRIYVFGGVNSTVGYTSDCYTAPVSNNGDIGTWTATNSLPGPLGSTQVVVIKNKVHLIGGYTGTVWAPNSYVADINADGTVGTWSVGGVLPYQTYEQCIVTSNKLYRIGRWGGGTVMYAPINADGSIGTWVSCTNLPASLCYSQAIVTSSKVYLLGGMGGANGTTWLSSCFVASFTGGSNDYSAYYQTPDTPGHGNPCRLQSSFNGFDTTDLKNWTNGPTLPDTVIGGSVIVTRNKIHVIGGYSGTGNYRLSTWTANIDANGIAGAWYVSQTLPVSMAHSSVLVVKNKVYLIGGVISASVSSAIYCSTIDTTGSLDTWSLVGNIPSISTGASAVATKNRVYVISGYNTGVDTTTNTYTAVINDDGTLGTWSAGPSLPVSSGYNQTIVTNGYVHCLCGFSAPAGTPAGIYSAPINADGTLGAWTTGTSIGPSISYHMSFVIKNRAFVVGGISGSYSAAVYTAPVNADGSLGIWTRATDLPYTVSQGSLAITGSRLYILGGKHNGVYSANTFSTSFTGGLNDYSVIYNGTVVSSSDEFKLPDLSSIETNGRSYFIKY